MKPTFSIITPTFNRGYILWKTIQSVQKQTYPFWEMLTIDDGSEDNTSQVIAEFQKDPRIKYFKIKNDGACVARNTGLKLSKGEFITYLDSDDYLHENFLSIVLEEFQKNPKKVFAIACHNRIIELLGKDFSILESIRSVVPEKEMVSLQDYYHWNVKTTSSGLTHKRKVIKDGIRWDPKIKRFQDWDFLMEMGNKYSEGFLFIPQVLFDYNQTYGGDSMCSKATYKDWANAFETIYQKHKNDPLMKGQTWYPQKVEKYTKLQKEFKKGRAIAPEFKYFPKYYNLFAKTLSLSKG